jgi:hypothetical protein
VFHTQINAHNVPLSPYQLFLLGTCDPIVGQSHSPRETFAGTMRDSIPITGGSAAQTLRERIQHT